jgi:hypothetical protein
MTDDEQPRINAGYALGQLVRSIATRTGLGAARAMEWMRVLAGLADGSLKVGSRTPIADVPAWVTLEVLHGGFASGSFAAAGPLQDHERDRLATLDVAGSTERMALNLSFLADRGRAELEAMLGDGCFRVHVPEEAALLVVAWLVRAGENERASLLLGSIAPMFDRLRFYPVPHEHPARDSGGVWVRTAGETAAALRRKRVQPHVARMNEALQIWAPRYDATVALWLETVEGDVPGYDRDPATRTVRRHADGRPIIAGGAPARRWPDRWSERAHAMLGDYAYMRARHRLCAKPDDPRENFARLRRWLAKAANDPASLAPGDIVALRGVLANFVERRGAPGSVPHGMERRAQANNASRPLHAHVGRVLAERLEREPADEGVLAIDALLGPLTETECARIGGYPGLALPPRLREIVRRCREADLASLVAERQLSSAEAMAMVVPAVTARVRAAQIDNVELRRVYAATYLAFRRRRSLLLLDLASQVRLSELPWISAIEPWVGSDDASRAAARDTLVELSSVALQSFPATILPNRLVKEMRVLGSAAGLTLPLVDELAADIFMGQFSAVFLRAAKVAAQLLGGSLYEGYFGIPYAEVAALDDVDRSGRAQVSSGFAAVCNALAMHANGASPVVRNGAVIEQAQIVTTHNLAVLFDALPPDVRLAELARGAFVWITHRQQLRIADWRARLKNVKNCAYAWRQMLFYLSLLPRDDVDDFLEWSDAHLRGVPEVARTQMRQLIAGLRLVREGERFAVDGTHPSGAHRFIGWSSGRHWLLIDE